MEELHYDPILGILTYDSVEQIRKEKRPNTIIAQKGCQEKACSSEADVVIVGGSRGGGKTFMMLMDAFYDINNQNFSGIILRKELDDLSSLAATAEKEVFFDFGTYQRTRNIMGWRFNKGGELRFSYFDGPYADFEDRFRGRQYAYIAIDEVTQIDFKKFLFLTSANRNSAGIHSRFIGTCNPDYYSWVRKFIDWFLDENYYPIPERDGKLRYFFCDGESVDDVYFGNTREEVYAQCKTAIDKAWKPKLEEMGYDKLETSIRSFTFIYGDVEDNEILLQSDPGYVGKLMNKSEEMRKRELGGWWGPNEQGIDRLSPEDMEKFFTNSRDMTDTTRYISADIAFEGGDLGVLWLWEGLHIKDCFVFHGSSKEVESLLQVKKEEWGVREENIVYDYWGIGAAIAGHMPRAVKFTGTSKPQEPYDKSYKNVKSQCAETLVHYIQDGKISIESRLLDKIIKGNNIKDGKRLKYLTATRLEDVLMKERKCIRQKSNSNFGGFELIDKKEMIDVLGYSPDFFEALIYRMWFVVSEKVKHRKPTGIAAYASADGTVRKSVFPGRLVKIRYT